MYFLILKPLKKLAKRKNEDLFFIYIWSKIFQFSKVVLWILNQGFNWRCKHGDSVYSDDKKNGSSW